MALNSRGEMNAFPPLPSSSMSQTPPFRVGVQHAIVCSIELESGTQQMGGFDCAHCGCVASCVSEGVGGR